MDVIETTEGIQYVTAGDSGEQQIYIQSGDGAQATTAAAPGQSLLQGAQIIDGKLVLPQQYQYVTENGETVMLVYETPDGQQIMAENGEQIVFLDESQGSQEEQAAAAAPATEVEDDGQVQQTTYIQRVGADGQTFLQQVTPEQAALAQQQMDSEEIGQDAGGYVQVSTDEQTGQTTYMTTAGGATEEEQQTFVHSGMQEIQPGQSLLLPNLANQRPIHQQMNVSEDGQTSTVVMVSSDGAHQQPVTSMAFMEEGVDGGSEEAVTHQVTMTTSQQQQQQEAALALLQQGQMAVQYTDGNGALQMSMQGETHTETTEILQQPDGSSTKIVIKMMKPEEEEDGSFESPAPITVMHIPHDQVATTHIQQDEGSLAAAHLMAPQENLEPEPEPFHISEEPDEEGRVTRIDPFTGELVKVMPEPEPDIPVLIHPEEFETAEDELEDELAPEVQLTMHKGVAEVNILNMPVVKSLATAGPRTPKAATPASTLAITPSNFEGARSASNATFDEEDDDESDSDFDEENLTPKVVYERLLAQHRKTKECQVCGDTLESYPKLKEHLMEHAGYNPCECQICGKILSTSAQRAKHEITHTKTKTQRPDGKSPLENGSPKKLGIDDNKEKYECDICGRLVGRPEHLKRHKKIHEPGPTWRCIICEYSFKREDLVKDHVKKQHKDALEMEVLKDLYEKLQFEENSQLKHKSQWNPRRKSGAPKTPKVPKVQHTTAIKVEMGAALAAAAAGETQDPALPQEEGAVETKTEPQEGEEKPPAVALLKQEKPAKTPKVKKEPKPPKVKKPEKETPTGSRKSGRTPKPKKMYDFVFGEDIKVENEEVDDDDEDSDEDSDTMTTASSPIKEGKMKVKLDLKKKTPGKIKAEKALDTEAKTEEEEESEPLEEPMETEEPDEPQSDGDLDPEIYTEDDPSLIRTTEGKSVTVVFQSSADQPRGVKRKANKMDSSEDVVILHVKGPKTGKCWKPFTKSTGASPSRTPSSQTKNTPSSSRKSTLATSKKSAPGSSRKSAATSIRKPTPTSSPKSTPSSSYKSPGGKNTSAASSSSKKRGRPFKVQLAVSTKNNKDTPKSRGRPKRNSTPGRGTFLKTLGVVKKESNRYEDDEFVYFDDGEEEEMLAEEDSDEIIVVRGAGSGTAKRGGKSQRGRPKTVTIKESPQPRKGTTLDGTPVRRGGLGDMKMPIVLLTRTDFKPSN